MRLIDLINQGGAIMWILVGLNIIGTSVILWRAWALWDFSKTLETKVSDFLKEFFDIYKKDQVTETLAKDFIAAKVADQELGMTIIKIIATIAPLLGLLGTVVGIFDAFQVISEKGLSNPADFAQGISLALITTIGGLVVSIPHYIAHNFLSVSLDKVEMKLEKLVLPQIFSGNN